jgi:outer membrane protein TolC
MSSRGGLALAIMTGSAVIVSGCRSPLESDEEYALLQRAVSTAIEHELLNDNIPDGRLLTQQTPSDVEAELGSRLDELNELGPGGGQPLTPDPLGLGRDLNGLEQAGRGLSLQQAIATAVTNNLDVQVSRLQPAINEADVVVAEAAFDSVFFANTSWNAVDAPTSVPTIGGVPLGIGTNRQDAWRYDTGIRKRTVSGADVYVSTDLTKIDDKNTGLTFSPNPAYTSHVNLGFSQPLLRGFGSDVNTASIRLARNAERSSIHDVRLDLLGIVSSVETAYWDLVLAWNELVIRDWLVEVGMEDRRILDNRREFDTTVAQYSDAVARVEQRRAEVVRTRRRVRRASDQLKLLINDPEMTVGVEDVFMPLDETVATPINYSLRDALVTALGRRPEVAKAVLLIDDATIREMLADNLRLPMLNLQAEMAFGGLDSSFDDSYSNLADGDFVDYFIALALEVPIGNREAEASMRRARLERSGAVIAYRRAIQTVVIDVKNTLRDVVTNYELIEATRSFRIAQAENLRALREQEQISGLTPEFVNLKLNTQESLASARFQEVQALANFDQSVAELYRAMGVGLEMNQIDLQVSAVDDATIGNGDSR